MLRTPPLAHGSAALVLLLGWVFAGGAGAQGLPSAAEPPLHACPGAGQVLVRAAAASDAQTACEGVQQALLFLARAGLSPPPSTTVEIVPELPGELAGRAVGCYLRETRSIRLLTYEAFEAGGQWFRMKVDRDLYRSVAAHEMAHAVVGCHSEPRLLPVAAHEYVAYVVLFATMEPGLRQRLLAKFPGSGFSSTLQINDINHIANPNQYGVDVWRHYLNRPNRSAWLREVISGQVIPEFPRDGP